MTRRTTENMLRAAPFLESLSRPQLGLVGGIARFKSCVAGQRIIQQGTTTHGFYVPRLAERRTCLLVQNVCHRFLTEDDTRSAKT